MYQAIIIIHVLLGLGIIGLVLMQQGKGADAGAAFGTGASGSVFGAQGAASFLSRTTAILATLFFTTSLGLAVLNSNRSGPVDIMSGANDKESLALPNVEGATDAAKTPAVPQPATEAAPAVENKAPIEKPEAATAPNEKPVFKEETVQPKASAEPKKEAPKTAPAKK